MRDGSYHRVTKVNADSVSFTARAQIPHVQHSDGHVVIVGRFNRHYPRPFNLVYATNKTWPQSFAHSLES
jgi:NADP-dependent 3-hydroxy acid dehydrogenase YdfG